MLMTMARIFFLLILGIINTALGENVSIQYVIIHTTSNFSSSSSNMVTATATSTSTAVSNGPVAAAASKTATVTAPPPPRVSSPASTTSTGPILAARSSDHFFAVTYEHQIPGVPGKDYPIYSEIPQSHFECSTYKQSGYYADENAGCQVIHMCQDDGAHESFLCPNGTIFNQQYLVCDWWFNVDCSKSKSYYSLNVDFGKPPDRHSDQSGSESMDQYTEEEIDDKVEYSAEVTDEPSEETSQ